MGTKQWSVPKLIVHFLYFAAWIWIYLTKFCNTHFKPNTYVVGGVTVAFWIKFYYTLTSKFRLITSTYYINLLHRSLDLGGKPDRYTNKYFCVNLYVVRNAFNANELSLTYKALTLMVYDSSVCMSLYTKWISSVPYV